MLKVLAFLALVTPPGQELTERDVKALVLAYVDGKEAKGTLDKLRGAKSAICQKVIRSVITEGKDSRLPKAISLAIELKISGLWDLLSKRIDGPDEEAIIKLVFTTQEAAPINALIQRWSKLENTSPGFKLVNDALKTYGVSDIKSIETLKEFASASDPVREDGAASALTQLFGVDTKEALLDNFESLKAEFATFGRPLPFVGQDAAPFLDTSLAKRIGVNYKLEGGGIIRLDKVPDSFSSGPLVFHVQLYPMEVPSTVDFVGDSKGQRRSFKVECDEKDWFVRGGDGSLRQMPIKPKSWNQLEFELMPFTQRDAHPCSRHVKISVNGKPLLPDGCLTGEWAGVVIQSKGKLYAGALSITKK